MLLERLLGVKQAGVPSISDDGRFVTAPLSWLPWLVSGRVGDATTESALGLPTVYACIQVMAEDIASLPLILYRRLPGGGKERATDHPLYDVFHDAPNPDMTSFQWRHTLVTHALGWGNGYDELTYDDSGRLQIWPISRPTRIEVKVEAGRKVYYDLEASGGRKKLAPGSIFHVMGQSLNGYVGLSPIAVHRATLGEQMQTRVYGRAFYDNLARPATVLTHPKTLSVGAIERLAAQMEALKGSRNAGKTVVLEEGSDFKEIGISPEDAQYIETRKFQREEACQIYRMPPHKVGILDHATFSNIEHQAIDYVTGTLRPWLVRIEQAIKTQLLFGEDDYFAEFLIDGLLRGDSKARSEALATQWQHGVINADDWNEIENRNPLGGEKGKTYFVPVNYQPIEKALKPAPEPTPAAPVIPELNGNGKGEINPKELERVA